MKKFSPIYILSFALLACGAPSSEQTPELAIKNESHIELSDASVAALNISSELAEEKNLSTQLLVTGVLDVPPEQKQSVTLSYPGKITKIPLINGMHIHKGELLYEFENPEFIRMQEQYLICKSDLELAEKNLARQQVLSEGKVNAQKEVDQAQNQVDRLKAQQYALKENLRIVNISVANIQAKTLSAKVRFYADANYWVQEVKVNKGSYAQEGAVVMDLINLDHIHLELRVFEKDIHSIEVGQKIRFKLPHENQEREGEVYLISRTVQSDRTIQVHAHLAEEDAVLLPGTFVQARITINQPAALVLPVSALQVWQGKSFVFEQLDKNNFEMIEISNPIIIDTFMVIDSSLKNRRFVANGTFQLLSSLKNAAEEE